VGTSLDVWGGSNVAEQVDWVPSGIDISIPNHARVYDYFLGGKDNFAADRAAAEKLASAAPDLPLLARANRGFLVRAVRLLAESGIRQFIDIGTGIPTSPSVHEVAREVDPTARVVYVDIDPMVVVHNAALLATNDGVITIEGDGRKPDTVLGDRQLQALIDFDEPVGVLFVAVMHLFSPADDPAGTIARFRDRMAPGSHVAICQFSSDSDPAGIAQFDEIYRDSPLKLTFRDRDEIAGFFDGFELLPPGVVNVEDWRPELASPTTSMKIVGGVGRKN
jgi:hypothetical protein